MELGKGERAHRSLLSVGATERWQSLCFSPGCFRASDTSEPGTPLGPGGTVGSEQAEASRWKPYHPSGVLDQNGLCLPLSCLTGLHSSLCQLRSKSP